MLDRVSSVRNDVPVIGTAAIQYSRTASSFHPRRPGAQGEPAEEGQERAERSRPSDEPASLGDADVRGHVRAVEQADEVVLPRLRELDPEGAWGAVPAIASPSGVEKNPLPCVVLPSYGVPGRVAAEDEERRHLVRWLRRPIGNRSVCLKSLSRYLRGPKAALCASVGALMRNSRSCRPSRWSCRDEVEHRRPAARLLWVLDAHVDRVLRRLLRDETSATAHAASAPLAPSPRPPLSSGPSALRLRRRCSSPCRRVDQAQDLELPHLRKPVRHLHRLRGVLGRDRPGARQLRRMILRPGLGTNVPARSSNFCSPSKKKGWPA